MRLDDIRESMNYESRGGGGGGGMPGGAGGIGIVGVVVLSLVVAWAARLTPSSANQVPISAMLVLSIGATTPDYALDRVLETVIGAAVALAVNALVVPPVLLGPAHLAVGRLARDVAAVLDELATVLEAPAAPGALEATLEKARGLRDLQPRHLDAETLDMRELKHRLLVTQALEAARTVEEGVITDPREADVGSILGFGFAPFTGGALSYIDFMGAGDFVDLCRSLQSRHGDRFAPPAILREMAESGETFYGRAATGKAA